MSVGNDIERHLWQIVVLADSFYCDALAIQVAHHPHCPAVNQDLKLFKIKILNLLKTIQVAHHPHCPADNQELKLLKIEIFNSLKIIQVAHHPHCPTKNQGYNDKMCTDKDCIDPTWSSP